jgi:hypothetical protein
MTFKLKRREYILYTIVLRMDLVLLELILLLWNTIDRATRAVLVFWVWSKAATYKAYYVNSKAAELFSM